MPTLLFIGILNGSKIRHRPGLHRPHTTYRTTAPGRINNSNIMPKTAICDDVDVACSRHCAVPTQKNDHLPATFLRKRPPPKMPRRPPHRDGI